MKFKKRFLRRNYFHQKMLKTVSNLKDNYNSAIQTEKNLQTINVNQRLIHSETILAKKKYIYLMRQARLRNIGVRK